ncbi:unnamed protein product [Heligmosomoides polygyrus]|uniref:Phlebovirus_G2 domain-containing protein n=1 Tax=Heligmosomoides polygyrus TaxID=6339 RepID=A0A183G6N0_HELPZ|nr:unnamed protein product [Heligmosomoides polygyrus]
MNNGTSLHEIRVSWKSLLLSCEPETRLYTRDTLYQVIDSKRCPHSGSCVGEKCAGINGSSLLPELEEGNKYPGGTACVESCGGPGCDCFFLSSGCLFYRIYLKPSSPKVFQVFSCLRWTEAAKVKISYVDSLRKTASSLTEQLRPNIPLRWKQFTFTLSVVAVPTIPLLQTWFISDGIRTAVWNNQMIPPLQCDSMEKARTMDCVVNEDCTCYPAETTANCQCKELNISAWINKLDNQLPVVLPYLSFKADKEGIVQAVVPNMVTSEIIMTFQEDLRTEVIVDDSKCSITASQLNRLL